MTYCCRLKYPRSHGAVGRRRRKARVTALHGAAAHRLTRKSIAANPLARDTIRRARGREGVTKRKWGTDADLVPAAAAVVAAAEPSTPAAAWKQNALPRWRCRCQTVEPAASCPQHRGEDMDSHDRDEHKGPVLHIVVVGFHHKKGCQVWQQLLLLRLANGLLAASTRRYTAGS